MIDFSKFNIEASLLTVFRFWFADIRRSTRPFLEDKTEDDFFQIDVRPPTPLHSFNFIAVK
jgi:hypothetical protein